MYSQEHYNEVLNAIVKEFHLDVPKIPGVQWVAWRVAIKRLFDQDILIREIIEAIPQASKKMDWPQNTAFFHRIEDIVYLNRKRKEKIIKVDEGLTKITFNSAHPSYEPRPGIASHRLSEGQRGEETPG
jgi:hypothetical protein